MQAKVCGLKTADQVESCIEHGADFCGFILNYKKSHRFIDYQTAEHLTKINKKNTSYVGVLVNPTIDEIEKFSNLNLDYFQIYGELSIEQLVSIKSKYNKKIIMALQIKKKQDGKKTTLRTCSVISTIEVEENKHAPVQCPSSNHPVHQEYVVNHQYIFLIFLFQWLNDDYVRKRHLIIDLRTNQDVSYMVHY